MSTRPAARWLPWLLLVAVGVGAWLLRFDVIESKRVMQHCSDDSVGGWCGAVQFLIQGFLTNGYGYAALAAALLALLWKHPFSAWLAAALGLFALNLYCYEAGALAVLIGCLRLLRQQASPAPPAATHRQRDGEVQAQP